VTKGVGVSPLVGLLLVLTVGLTAALLAAVRRP
jgi:hypothetical protein